MRTVIGIAAALLASPALAEDCVYVAASGYTAIAKPMALTIRAPDGTEVTCEIFGGGTEVTARGLSCADGYEGVLFYAPSTLDGGADNLLITRNAVWYFDGCRENA